MVDRANRESDALLQFRRQSALENEFASFRLTMSFPLLFPSETHGATPVVILDGGMGTTLQRGSDPENLDSAKWSGELLETSAGRQKLARLHEGWIEVGAEVLGSCS